MYICLTVYPSISFGICTHTPTRHMGNAHRPRPQPAENRSALAARVQQTEPLSFCFSFFFFLFLSFRDGELQVAGMAFAGCLPVVLDRSGREARFEVSTGRSVLFAKCWMPAEKWCGERAACSCRWTVAAWAVVLDRR